MAVGRAREPEYLPLQTFDMGRECTPWDPSSIDLLAAPSAQGGPVHSPIAGVSLGMKGFEAQRRPSLTMIGSQRPG
jgi:hypothetical protein